MLTLIWFALTAFGSMAIVRSTQTTLERAHAQFAADAVVLAHLDHGPARAARLADRLGVVIENVAHGGGGVTIEVRTFRYRATATAK